MTPVTNWNCRGARKVSEAAMRSAARRRVRKSRGEQAQTNSENTIGKTRLSRFGIGHKTQDDLKPLTAETAEKNPRRTQRRDAFSNEQVYRIVNKSERVRGG